MNWNGSKLVYVAKVNNLRYDCHFVATNDDVVWKDTPDQKSVNAAFKNREDMAETIPYDNISNVGWTAVEIRPGCYARFKNAEEYQVGDTPYEATKYLDFDEVYEIDRDNITEKETLEGQIVDILRKLHGSVHYTTIPNYINYREISSSSMKPESILEELDSMEPRTSVYRTKDGDDWWSAR